MWPLLVVAAGVSASGAWYLMSGSQDERFLVESQKMLAKRILADHACRTQSSGLAGGGVCPVGYSPSSTFSATTSNTTHVWTYTAKGYTPGESFVAALEEEVKNGHLCAVQWRGNAWMVMPGQLACEATTPSLWVPVDNAVVVYHRKP